MSQNTLQQTAAKTISPAPASSILQRLCACGSHASGGECESCRRKSQDSTGLLQRYATAPGKAEGEVPSIVHEVLRSPGQPLDPATRAFMQPRFGHDFSQVRVHTDAKAAESARMVNALAYTVGRNVIFSSGQYAPSTRLGKNLLAHELAHVVQQPGVIYDHDQLKVGDPDSLYEREAGSVSEAVLGDLQFPNCLRISSHPILARQQIQVQARTMPRGRLTPRGRRPIRWRYRRQDRSTDSVDSEDSIDDVEQQRRDPRPLMESEVLDDSYEGRLEHSAEERYRRQRIWELERPVATLIRGGRPPDFITEQYREEWSSYHQTSFLIPYQFHEFHILDAIDYEVGLANNEQDLQAITDHYILSTSIYTQGLTDFVIQDNFDPGAQRRLEVFYEAVRRRSTAVPELARALQLRPETERDRRFPGILPICWPLTFGPPMFMGVGVSRFRRTTGVERDIEDATQRRLQLRYRQDVDPDFNARYYHVHHVVPLFLGGLDAAAGNLTILQKDIHLNGHNVLRYQPQMANPSPPLQSLSIDLYDHPAGTEYELVGYKSNPFDTC